MSAQPAHSSLLHPILERREQMLLDLRRCVPHEMRDLAAWLLWKAEPKPGKPGEFDKVPYYANGHKRRGVQGSAEDVEQLVDFAAVIQALERDGGRKYAGVGLAILPCHPVTALDLDKLDEHAPAAAIADSIANCGTYCETSPSGRGRRAFFDGKLGFGNVKNHAAGVEVFESAGFVTVTGAEVSTSADLKPMPDTLRATLANTLGKPKVRAGHATRPSSVAVDLGTLPPALAERLRRGFPDRKADGSIVDRSAYLFGLCRGLQQAGLDAAQALGVLGDPELPWLVPGLERRGGDIESARDWLWQYTIEPIYSDEQPAAVTSTDRAESPAAATKAEPQSWSIEPVDFLRKPTAPPFTTDDVPRELGAFAVEQARAGGFDPSAMIAAVVGAAAGALSDGLRLAVSENSDYYESARLWILQVGAPGAAKTPVIKSATKPIHAMHAERIEDWKRRAAVERKRAEAAGEEPEIPPRPALYANDVTVEALAELLSGNPRGVLLINEEFESWLGQHDAYRSGGSKDRGEWLRTYDGGPHQVDRVKRGSFFVPNWGVGILTATTPTVLQKLSRKLPADGLLQRFIPVMVAPMAKIDRAANAQQLAQGYHNTLVRLYEYGPDQGVRLIRMSGAAEDAMHAERERLRELALAVGVYGDGFAGHVAKHAGMLARLALVFHAVSNASHPADRHLEVDSVEMAARFMAKVFQHARALYTDLMGAGSTSAVSLARAVAAVLLADNRQFVTRRELSRSCHAWDRAETDFVRTEAMQFLEDMGWVREVPGAYQKGYPTKWAINPSAHATFAQVGETHRALRKRVADAIRGAGHD